MKCTMVTKCRESFIHSQTQVLHLTDSHGEGLTLTRELYFLTLYNKVPLWSPFCSPSLSLLF